MAPFTSCQTRTRDGLAAARARGRTGGQKAKLAPRQAKIAQDMYEELGPGRQPMALQVVRAGERYVARSAATSPSDCRATIAGAAARWSPCA